MATKVSDITGITIARYITTITSARSSDVQVLGSDRLRWAQYPGGKLYLLNTDFDLPITVKIIRNEREECVTLSPLELRAVD